MANRGTGTFRLKLFGSPVLTLDDAQVALSRRARALLAYLALVDRQSATRERLIGLFWPDRPETQARASLRQCLHELRKVLGDWLIAEREWIQFESSAVACDWHEIVSALADSSPVKMARALATIGREPLLDGQEFGETFDDWLRACRASCDARLAAGVLSHIERCRSRSDWEGALQLADAWAFRDPCDEAVAASAIAIEVERDAPVAARRRFRALESALDHQGDGPPGEAARAALEKTSERGGVEVTATTPVHFASMSLPQLPSKPSIAVMPFADLSGDGHDFADGMVEEIDTALSRFSNLFVISGRSSLSYRDSAKPLQHIASELGVRYLLQGSVRKAGGRVRIVVKLLDATIGEQIWAERFEETTNDIFALQDRIGLAVASRIDTNLTDAEMKRAVSRPTVSPDAYELCLIANARLTRYDRASVIEALTAAERAMELDPDYGWAVATAGFCRATLLLNAWSEQPDADLATVNALQERAMQLAGADLMALTVTAGLLATTRSAIDTASLFIERAMALNPQKAFVLFWAGIIDCECGRFARGLDRLEQTARLDPCSVYRPWILTWMGNCLIALERYDEAVVVLAEARRLLPSFPVTGIMFAVSLALFGERHEAQREFERLDEFGGYQHCEAYIRIPELRDAVDRAFRISTSEAA